MNNYQTRTEKRKKRKKHRRLRNILIVVLLTCILICAAAYYGFYFMTGSTLMECYEEAYTSVEGSTEDSFKPNGITYIYDANGVLLAELSKDKSSNYLKYSDIPSDAVNAFVAVEDRTFWDNRGYDIKGIARSALDIVRSAGSSVSGGSTITQQLCKLTYLTNEKTVERKVREIFLSVQMTQKYTKQRIMEFYINNCCFANNIYGLSDASWEYFGKSPKKCTLSEIAYLCAIPNRPEYYNPLKNPDNALRRRDKILADMLECGYINERQYNSAIYEEITIKSSSSLTEMYNYETTYAIDCAVECVMKDIGFAFKYSFSDSDEYDAYQEEYNEAYQNAKQKLYTGGYVVRTSLDVEEQKELRKIIDGELSGSTKKNESTGTYNLQGAMTVIDNRTGKVVGIIGGRSDEIDSVYTLNRAYQSYRQPGSSIKPLVVYTPALEMGKTKYTTLKEINVQSAYKNPKSISLMGGTSYSLENAVVNSRNGCAIYLYNQVTPKKGLGYLHDMEFKKIVADDNNLSSGLGGLTYGVTTVEMANAYSTLACHGMYTSATCIVSMEDSESNEIFNDDYTYRVYSKKAADSMTDILKGVVTSGTAKSMNWYSSSDVQVAGKTGTTNDSKDAWFCGYSPDYTVSIWVGNDDNSAESNMYGNGYPSKIFKKAMLQLTKSDSNTTRKFSLSLS